MFHSIKKWAKKTNISIYPFISYSGIGVKNLGTVVEHTAYKVDEKKVVNDLQGSTLTSETQLYIDPTVDINELDVIELESKMYDIKTIGKYLHGVNASLDLWVIYI